MASLPGRSDRARSASMRISAFGLVVACVTTVFFAMTASAAQDVPGQARSRASAQQATATAAIDVTSSLVNTVDLAALSPPSPDPSGLAYVPESNTLLMTDGDVEEEVNGITHFQGANVWELTLGGGVVRTTNISSVEPTVFPMSEEPSGVAFKSSSGHCFVADDSQKQIYTIHPGTDGLCGTGDDSSTFFATSGVGNVDPEGIAYDTWNDRLFVADGTNREIYQYTTAGALVAQFDVQAYGVEDPETVEFNPVSGTLFVLSNRQSGPIIIETTTSGALLQTIDVSAAGATKPAGLAYAPASDGSGVMRFYIVDRGMANTSNPTVVDGKMYELTAPQPGTPGNAPPSVNAGPDQSVTLPASATLDASVSDDGQPNPVTSVWSQLSGPSTVSFGNANAVDTTASAPIAGTYVLRLTASDGEFTTFDEMTLTVSGTGSVAFLDVRVNASPDDAEETDTNSMRLANADLDMLVDDAQNNLAVGLRFNGIAIPQGSTITNAYVQFEADQPHANPTSLVIKGQAADNPPTFSGGNKIMSRPTTVAATPWSPDPWLTVGETGFDQRTSNLAAVIQEIVNRANWTSSNSLVLIITGGGRRVAEAWDSNPAAAPLLHVEWATGGSGNSPPQITSNGGGAIASVSAAENQTAVTEVNATDPNAGDTLIYSITNGADMTAFAIDSGTGVLTFVSSPDFELPTDVGLNNVYDVTVQVSDGNGGTDTQAIAVTVTNVNEFPPVITSDGSGASAALSTPENQTGVTDVDATDGDNQALTYSISGGPDAARFTIVPGSGVLSFVTAPNFEAPMDAGLNNVYDVTVSASDGSLSDTQALTVTVTDVVEAPGSPLYFSLFDVGTVSGVTAENEDVVFFDGASFSLAFDGSDVGLASFRIDAFTWIDADSILLSFDAPGTVSGIAVDDSDIVRFDATALGATTAGTFSLYFDGSDVLLTAGSEDLDAVELLANGHILVSTTGAVAVTGVSGDDKDLLEFTPGSLGASTAGTFTLYFDGSDVGLTTSAEDIDAAAVDGSGKIYLSTLNNFAVPGVSGADEDVFVFTPTLLGSVTSGTYSSTLYFDGSAFGLTASDVFAIDLP